MTSNNLNSNNESRGISCEIDYGISMESWRENIDTYLYEEEQKKAAHIEIENKIYEQLYINCFLPISEGIIEFSKGNYFLPTLRFNVLADRQSLWYKHGLKHLMLDIDNFDSHFKELEEKVGEYNKNLENFDGCLEELVISYFIQNGFEINSPSTNRHEINTVDITFELIDRLKDNWLKEEKMRINYQWEEDKLNIGVSSSTLTLGAFSTHMKDDIINCLFNIRDYEPILKLYNNVYKSLDKIMTDAEKLCNDINENVIMKCQIGTYKTPCEECKKLNNNQ